MHPICIAFGKYGNAQQLCCGSLPHLPKANESKLTKLSITYPITQNFYPITPSLFRFRIAMSNYRLIVFYTLFFAMIWPFTACKSQKALEPAEPEEVYDPFLDTPVVSIITIPVRITKYELNRLIESQMSGPLYEDYSYTDQGNDELMMNLWKNGPVDVEVFSNLIKYKIPLKYWLKKKLFIGEAESEGAFELSFKTSYTLNPDWTINTNTVTEYYNWTSPPVIKTGWGDITIQWIANLLINRSKAEIASQIDESIKTNLNIGSAVKDAWIALQSPTLISQDYEMWLKVTPQSIRMTPLCSDGEAILSKIGVQCVTDVTFGEKPLFRKNNDLLTCKW